MIATWMLYIAGTSLLVGLAAAALEGVVLRSGRSGRWLWVGSIGVSALLPPVGVLLARLPSGGGGAVGVWVGEAVPIVGPAVANLERSTQTIATLRMPELDGVLGALWLAGSGALLLALVVSAIALAFERRRWSVATIDGREVHLSDSTGPAVFGLRHLRIVLPRWVAALEERKRQLVISHEEEHVRARDPYLLLFAAAALVAYPWSLPLWWQARRLAGAIEIDCDRRVLARSSAKREYGELLLLVGGKERFGALPAAAFAAQPNQLERRIRMIAKPSRPPKALTVLGIAGFSSLLLFVACSMDAPAEPVAVTELEAAAGAGSGSLPPAESAFVPDQNDQPEVVAQRTIDPNDFPPGTIIQERPGRPPVIIPPADQRTPVAQVERPAGQLIGRPTGTDADTIPTFTPYEVRPELLNRSEFAQELDRRYPPMLKDAGIGGTVVMWVLIDQTGQVAHTRLVTGSGDSRLDRVALELMRAARFRPAINDDERVAVWVQLPVTFQAAGPPAPRSNDPQQAPQLRDVQQQ